MGSIRIENTAADLLKTGHKLHVMVGAGCQLNVTDTIGFETDADHQLAGVILDCFDKRAGFEF
ncbi:hypothetical protein D3C80_2045410 [compost metagenome]